MRWVNYHARSLAQYPKLCSSFNESAIFLLIISTRSNLGNVRGSFCSQTGAWKCQEQHFHSKLHNPSFYKRSLIYLTNQN